MKKTIFLAITIIAGILIANPAFSQKANKDDNNTGKTGTITDSRDGKTYKTVKIGEQWWMAENLAYDVGDGSWAYNNDESNVKTYGRLYKWKAAKIACPSGWHLPTDDEWKQMEMAIGMSQSEADDTGWRGTNEGTKLKATSGWIDNGNGTDDYGFSGLPGGYRYPGGSFITIGSTGVWWSATMYPTSTAWSRYLRCDRTTKFRYYTYEEYGFSVRCVKD
jgi:uncharacterized protein (TIGR02145 family)